MNDDVDQPYEDPPRGLGTPPAQWPPAMPPEWPPAASYGWAPAPPPAKRRRTWVWVTAGVIALAVAAGVLGVVAGGTKGGNPTSAAHTLTVPPSSGSYTQLTGTVADRLTASMQNSLRSGGLKPGRTPASPSTRRPPTALPRCCSSG